MTINNNWFKIMTKKVYHTLHVDTPTYNAVHELARRQNMTKTKFLNELFANIVDVASGFNELGILYSGSFIEGRLIMNFVGRRNIQFGTTKVEGESDEVLTIPINKRSGET